MTGTMTGGAYLGQRRHQDALETECYQVGMSLTWDLWAWCLSFVAFRSLAVER